MTSPWVDAEQLTNAGQYGFHGSGMTPGGTIAEPMVEPMLWVNVFMEPELMRSFIGKLFGELPLELQQLIRNLDQLCADWDCCVQFPCKFM